MNITLDNVSFSYKKGSPLLEGVNFSFESGNCYVLSGANGSGKTTLSKLMTGLLKASEGNILIDGENAGGLSKGKIARKIGYIFQNPDMQFFASAVKEELLFPYELTGGADAETVLKAEKLLCDFGLDTYRDTFPLLLSEGEKQRLALASVIIREPGFIIFDEPSASLDGGAREFLSGFINGFTVNGGAVVITHDEDFAATLTNKTALKLRGGKIEKA